MDVESQLRREEDMKSLRTLVATLIKVKFIPQKEGKSMLKMLSSIDYRADEYVNDFGKCQD